MTGARRRALLFLLVAAIAAAALALVATRGGPAPLPARPEAQRPPLLLLTSLPLIFGEDFSLSGGGSPTLNRLETRYRVIPISVTSAGELAKGRLLLLPQPPAQTAENLVTLDAWVRRGGRLLLLADPMLEWPSKRPLGDPLRPPPMFMDTGLLDHWGLTLDAPEERGPGSRELGSRRIIAASPGGLRGACPISSDRLVARCRIGKGRATIVADADLLDAERLGPDARSNLEAVLAELAALEQK